MKSRFLKAVLVLSLGANAGVLGMMGVNAVRRSVERERHWRRYYPDRASYKRAEQRMDEFDRQLRALREEFGDARPALGRLALADEPDSAEVEQALVRLAEHRRRWTRLSVDFVRSPEFDIGPEERTRRAVATRASLDSARAEVARRWPANKEGR
ncbi:MAG: hypothetical protein R6X14_03995 [bacterium]